MPGISVPCLISAVSTLAPGVLALAPGELPQATTIAANTSGASAAARIVAHLFILIKILLLVNV
jgi:hypothetical protein